MVHLQKINLLIKKTQIQLEFLRMETEDQTNDDIPENLKRLVRIMLRAFYSFEHSLSKFIFNYSYWYCIFAGQNIVFFLFQVLLSGCISGLFC